MSNTPLDQLIINTNPIIEFSPDGKILWANDAYLELTGYELHEIVGKEHTIFLPPNHQLEFAYKILWENLLQGKEQIGQYLRVHKDGSPLWIHATHTPILDENGKVQKIYKVAIDLTEQKAREITLEKRNKDLFKAVSKTKAANEAKTQFLVNVSHELRTPLNSIIGITEALSDTGLSPHQEEYIHVLQRANAQLLSIINDLLDFNSIERGNVSLAKQPFETRKFADEVLEGFENKAHDQNLELKVYVAPDVPLYIYGDRIRLRQVVQHLLNNALKFTTSGSIKLTVQRNRTKRKGNIIFGVEDTGIGIATHKVKNIFDSFSQGDSTNSRRYAGTGLGLTIAKRIVQLMDGDIWVESEEGVGSRFFFTAYFDENLDSIKLLNDPHFLNNIPELCKQQSLKILVVDDVADNRNIFNAYLRKLPHQLSFAQDGIEAITLMEKNHYDIVFMDIQMPGIDGYETTMRIRDMERKYKRPRTRIFACTANSLLEDIQKSFQAGCDYHITKPLKKEALYTLIAYCVSAPNQPIHS